jgi:hypothetical protein
MREVSPCLRVKMEGDPMRTFVLAACMAAALVAGGCGDDDDNDSVTNPGTGSGTGTAGGGSGTGGGDGTTGCTQTTVAERAQADLGRNAWDPLAFTTTTDGRVDITVDWTNQNANVGAFLVSGGSCSQAQFQGNQCSFILASGDDRPHQMSARIPAGSYELVLQNFGGTPQSAEPVSATVVLSVGESCPAFPAPSPAPSASPTPGP